MQPRDLLVATHGHCFDGMASAALFTSLVRQLDEPGRVSFRYLSCGYGPGMQMVPEAWLNGDESAILDFRYTNSPRVRWYFDHHITGFGSDEERRNVLATAAPPSPTARPQIYYDPTYGSCSKLIADVASSRFGIDMSQLGELITWADRIDSASFESAEAATNLDEPVLQLAGVVEVHADGPFLVSMVPRLLETPLGEIARSAEVQTLWAPIRALRETIASRVERAGKVRGRVVFVDLTDAPLEVAAKFVTYSLFPTSTYSVTLARTKQHYKLSVGYNPWCGKPRTHDVAPLCRRFGGGGHPAVGACSFPLDAEADAQRAAATIVNELNG